MKDKILSILKLIRMKHWIKNLLIFAPLFFVGNGFTLTKIYPGLILFAAFSALASCIYVLNDLIDAGSDRLHPIKKNRPIASGKIKRKEAIILISFLFIIATILSLNFPLKVLIILITYFVSNLAYSFWLKRLVIVDIFVVALMYLMRIYAGSKLWDIPLSHWIILCTFFAALFLITAKRRAELNVSETNDGSARTVLKQYNKDFLDHSLTISITATLVTYGLYCVSSEKPYVLYSVFFVTFGLMRYMYLVYYKNIGQAPEDTLIKDPYILGTSILWLLYNALILYFFTA